MFKGAELVGAVDAGAEVSFQEGPKCLLLGAEVSFPEGPKCLFEKGPKWQGPKW